MIEILNDAELSRARRAGALVADILQSLRARSAVGTNLLEIDRWAKAMIEEACAESCYVDDAPSFVADRRTDRAQRAHHRDHRRRRRDPDAADGPARLTRYTCCANAR